MDFPHPFVPDMATRAGRMMSAGRCKVTVMNAAMQEHFTVLYVCFADNREKQYDPNSNKRWMTCELADATHLFAEVPTPSGSFNDKIGTYYPNTGRWYDANEADPQRIRAAMLGAQWLQNRDSPLIAGFSFVESVECGKCGLELSDPVSVARGIGPDCYGQLTGSKHQTKWMNVDHPGQQMLPEAKVAREPNGTVRVEHAHKYHETTDVEESYEDLGLPTAAENAAYGLLSGMSEDQLETCAEWVQMRLQKVVAMRHSLVEHARAAEADVPYGDQAFLGR
jgi:hypothetical protein